MNVTYGFRDEFIASQSISKPSKLCSSTKSIRFLINFARRVASLVIVANAWQVALPTPLTQPMILTSCSFNAFTSSRYSVV